MQYPSHHAPDLQTVIKGINILTTAVKIPTTLMHIHVVDVDLEDNLKEDDIIDIWKIMAGSCFLTAQTALNPQHR